MTQWVLVIDMGRHPDGETARREFESLVQQEDFDWNYCYAVPILEDAP